MKTIFLAISIRFASNMLTNAQDTTSVPIKQDDPELRQSAEEIRQNNLKDMVKIDVREVPAELKKVMQRQEYKGDTKTYYKHKERDEYAVEIQSGEVTHFYLFDKNGRPINKQN
ncbi:MAG: hypothetical protein C0490_12130 [Marivirga sp.]|nr:hypothetical protein [Marivirga sp.]